jgi:alpha-N-arabinofuranosidase
MALSAELRGLGALTISESFQLRHDDLKAANTREAPDEVSPVAHPSCSFAQGALQATLAALSWNVFALKPVNG